jgi:hypothetical protein
LCSLAHVLMRLNPTAAIEVSGEAIVAVRAASDDVWLACDALCSKGFAHWFLGDTAAARAVADDLATLVSPDQPSRAAALAHGLEACVRLRETGPETARPVFDGAIAQLRSIGAHGLASYWQSIALRFCGDADDDRAITEWRDLLQRVRPDDMYADQVTTSVAIELAGRLASRGHARDMDEAMRLARRFFRTSGLTQDHRFFLPMATIALHDDRAEDAARLLGYIDAERARRGGASLTSNEIDDLRASVAAQVAGDALNRLVAEGSEMSEEDAVRVSLGEAAR